MLGIFFIKTDTAKKVLNYPATDPLSPLFTGGKGGGEDGILLVSKLSKRGRFKWRREKGDDGKDK
jgi:hypothetical protein